MTQGYSSRLETLSFGVQEVFPQLCSDIARGQDVENMKSIWDGGRTYSEDFEDGDSEDAEENESEGSSTFPKSNRILALRYFSFQDTYSSPTNTAQSQQRLQYLREEFDAFKAILQAGYDGFLGEQTEHGAIVKDSKVEVGTAERKMHALEIQLEDAQKEVAKWKQKYEKLQVIMRGAIEGMT